MAYNNKYKTARKILGDDLITPNDIEALTSIRYTKEQKAYALEALPIDLKKLKDIKRDNMILVFGPDVDRSLLSIRSIDNFYQLFWKHGSGWYNKDKETFARENKIRGAKWHVIGKTPLKGSKSKNWNEQKLMTRHGDYIPNAAEVTYAVVIYKKVRNANLFQGDYVRTSSVSSRGDHVRINTFAGLVSIDEESNYRRGEKIGVSSARQMLFLKPGAAFVIVEFK